ncbi:hypothetical protein HKCCE4037_06555 [Rhodobacterales bacterium HKCCE4037]|nr:hypothetical protein [Rhodobacterales bacterium HKCCE4037]
MRFVTWLTARTPAPEDPAPNWQPSGHSVLAQLEADAAARHEAEIEELADYGITITFHERGPKAATPTRPEREERPGHITLEPVFTVIDYCDAQGAKTRRRITMRSLAPAKAAPILHATCHERSAARAFRTDRIEWFLDDDGVATRPEDFFRDIMGIALHDIGTSMPLQDPALDAARAIREALRPELSILVAVARADHDFHIEELDVIHDYAERRVFELVDDGILPTDPDMATLDQLGRLIAKMRPTREALTGYLDSVLAGRNGVQGIRFVNTLERVIAADGVLDPAEAEILEDLTGLMG